MIQVIIYQDRQQSYKGFQIVGHAGYGYAGQDIICAAVSMLVVNTINSLQTFTSDQFEVESDEKKGKITCQIVSQVSASTKLLLDSLILGLNGVKQEYGTKYIRIRYKEV